MRLQTSLLRSRKQHLRQIEHKPRGLHPTK